MPLAFRSRPIPPNNRSLAVKRLSHLRTFLEYKEHYSQFAEGMLKDGHAELAAEMAISGGRHLENVYDVITPWQVAQFGRNFRT